MIEIQIIEKPKDCRYISREDQLYLKARLYIDRANEYLNENKYGHASGCLAKAAKKITQAQHIKLLTSDEGIDKILKAMIDTLSKNIADNILKGNGNESD